MLGWERNDHAGIMQSLDLLAEVAKKEEEYSKSNKKKADSRRSKAPIRKPKKGSKR